MIRSRPAVFALPLLLGTAVSLHPIADDGNKIVDARADSIAVARVVRNFHQALETGDSAKALSLLSTDAVILESGSVESRSEYRSHHLPEDIKFARAVPSKRGELVIRIAGSAAWTAATSIAQGEFNGRAINSAGAESMVLSNSPGGWKIRQIHWSSRTR